MILSTCTLHVLDSEGWELKALGSETNSLMVLRRFHGVFDWCTWDFPDASDYQPFKCSNWQFRSSSPTSLETIVHDGNHFSSLIAKPCWTCGRSLAWWMPASPVLAWHLIHILLFMFWSCKCCSSFSDAAGTPQFITLGFQYFRVISPLWIWQLCFFVIDSIYLFWFSYNSMFL